MTGNVDLYLFMGIGDDNREQVNVPFDEAVEICRGFYSQKDLIITAKWDVGAYPRMFRLNALTHIAFPKEVLDAL